MQRDCDGKDEKFRTPRQGHLAFADNAFVLLTHVLDSVARVSWIGVGCGHELKNFVFACGHAAKHRGSEIDGLTNSESVRHEISLSKGSVREFQATPRRCPAAARSQDRRGPRLSSRSMNPWVTEQTSSSRHGDSKRRVDAVPHTGSFGPRLGTRDRRAPVVIPARNPLSQAVFVLPV